MIAVADKKNSTKGPTTLRALYTEFLTVIQNYKALLNILFGINRHHFTQFNEIITTVKAIFCRNNGFINEKQRTNLIWEIHCNSRAFFGNIASSANMHNGTGTKASLESIHALIGSNIALALQYVQAQLYKHA